MRGKGRHMQIRSLLLLAIVFQAWGSLLAIQPDELYFRHILPKDGLSNNVVYSILEDDYGFVWIGTRDGLNRFDGSEFRIYDQFSGGLKNSHINSIYKDVHGQLWVGTYDGLGLYDQNKDRFTIYDAPAHSDRSLANNIRTITGNGEGDLWIGTSDAGLSFLVVGSDSIRVIQPVFEDAPDRVITRVESLLLENDSLLWFGAYEGLCRYHTLTGKAEMVLERWNDMKRRVQVLIDYDEQFIFAGTDGEGILKLDKQSGKFQLINSGNSILPNDFILDLKKDVEGQLLVGTDGGGLVIMDPDDFSMQILTNNVNDPNSLLNNSIYEIYYDSFRNLWIGSYAGGISFYSRYDRIFYPTRHVVNNPNSLSDNNVRSIAQDSRGDLWIGTRGGLNLRKSMDNHFVIFEDKPGKGPALSSNTILSLMDDHMGNMWIGTFTGGIDIINLDSWKISKFLHPDDENNSLMRSHIYDMLLTSTYQVWIATMGGVYRYNIRENTLHRFQPDNSSLLDNGVKVLLEDRKGLIWIGTNNGLNVLYPGESDFRSYQTTENQLNTLSSNRILTLLEDSRGLLWIGTEGGGVNILNPETDTFTHISSSDGLPNNVINAILEDHRGHFWITTNNGLVDYAPEEQRFRVYTEIDGLQSNQFYTNAGIVTGDRRILVGGPGGFNEFYPDSLVENNFRPKVLFTDLYLYNKPVTIGEEGSPLDRQLFLEDEIVLKHKQNNFSLHFTCIGFLNSAKSQYSTFLEGFDREWSDFSDSHSAVYANLKPGRYRFIVRAINSNGVTSEHPATIEVRVLPPPWKTGIAFVIYALVFIALLLLFRAYIISWTNVRNELEMQRREKEHMEEINQMKLRFFTNVSHEFKTPLTLIRGHLYHVFSQQNEEKRREAGNIISQNINRLLRLINELMDFRRAESGLTKLAAEKLNIVEFIRNICDNYRDLAESRSIRFSMDTQSAIPDIWFDPEKVEKIMFNLLSNAFKFTDEGGAIQVSIAITRTARNTGMQDPNAGQLSQEEDIVSIRVHNTGEGIAKEEIGLVFDRFFQSDKLTRNDTDQRQQGSGIGLAYSKRLVELHHGTIRVESDPDKGTVFTVDLPVGERHLTAEERSTETTHGYRLRMDSSEISTELFIRAYDTPKQIDQSLPVILVVEDNPSIIHLIRDQIGAEYNVLAAPNGREGLGLVERHLPELIISDLMMPVMNGIEFSRILKSEVATSHIPLIMLTAKTDDVSQISGLDTGADAFIKKPYNADVLRLTIRNLLESRRLLRKKFSGFNTLVPEEVTSNRLDEKFLDRLINIIDQRSGDAELDVVTVSREMGMSRPVLYRKIKSISGMTILEFVRICKLKKAANMLINTTDTVSEIAYASGFANAKHFSTSFRKHFGMTPTDFRNAPPSRQ